MIIGHLPAGYLMATALDRSFDRDRVVFWSILVGSVAPDLDMLRFFLVDRGAVHHHNYLTHDPTLWFGVLFLGFVLTSRALIGLGIGAVLHMVLDTVVGAVSWGYGKLSVSGPLVTVPATQDHWVLSFILHWTFLIELVICGVAVAVFMKRRKAAPD
ncbi:metal-dependent hydrolase [uncultured Tateyamaria sp.]|uniref:metal-dependent hydrolase n=1 Tax=uncultured Tateyamaria sp. TaxID=455651 RepID=UPI00260A639A|nr:metal-dependent hydrolase [uncultured Tateyamaria sp.]